MDSNSWLRLDAQDPQYQLPAALQQQDPRAARDCGWVEQMTPFISHYAQPGEWVIDPFCGFGSTLVAASIAGSPALGVELDAQRVALTRARLDTLGLDAARYPVWQGNLADAATQARCRMELDAGMSNAQSGSAMPQQAHAAGTSSPAQVAGASLPRIGLCLTNIPYFGCDPGEQDAPDQLYQTRYYEPYLQGLRDVFNGVHAILAPGAWCVVMVQNLRLGARGRFVPLAWDVARLLDERFVLHEERMLIYDRAHDLARLGAGGVSATNRAHEYALVCRKQARGVDVDAGLDFLQRLAKDGVEFVLYGSFADHLAQRAGLESAGDAHATSSPVQGVVQGHDDDRASLREPNDIDLNDIDLIVPPDEAKLSCLMQRLESDGFRIESWNAHVSPPVSIVAMAYRHYFRARRVDQHGNRLQLDVAVAATQAAFEDQRTKRCSTTSLPHWLPACSSANVNPASS